MQEELLHFIWKMKMFDPRLLRTQDKQLLRIIKPGVHNHNAGPDFLDSRIRIGETLWAGNVEIHIKASDWYKHNHHKDPAYKNVILHVVYEHDCEVYNFSSQKPVPVLELRELIPEKLIRQYETLQFNSHWIPCSAHLDKVPELNMSLWLERVLIERLEEKTHRILDKLEKYSGDWQECFYISLARYFGFNVNNEPFEQLAESLPSKLLTKNKNQLFSLEALLFGQAGLIPASNFRDEYPNALAREYRFLKHKYALKPMEAHQWKFLRTRPSNFPTIRIAQLANLIHKSSHLFSKSLEVRSREEALLLFDCKASAYWDDHYHFDKKAPKKTVKRPGQSSLENLLINILCPFLFAYGKYHKLDSHKQHALSILEQIPTENNRVIRKWKELGVRSFNAGRSQALIYLKKRFCDAKRCLDCQIGTYLLKH